MGKKDKRKAQEQSVCVDGQVAEGDAPQTEVMTTMTPPHKKRKKHRRAEDDGQEIKEEPVDPNLQTDEQKPEKKKKKRKSEDGEGDTSPPRAKKQKLSEKDMNENYDKSETNGEHVPEVAENSAKKKKKKKKKQHEEAALTVTASREEDTVNISQLEEPLADVNNVCDDDKSSTKDKKHKKDREKPKKGEGTPNSTDTLLENGPQVTSADSSSQKKKKNKKHKRKQSEENLITENSMMIGSTGNDCIPEKEKKKDKHKKNKPEQENESEVAEGSQDNKEDVTAEVKKTKKRKEKTEKSAVSNCEENGADDCRDITEEGKQKKKDKKKKRKEKVEHSIDQKDLAVYNDKDSAETLKPKKESKKKKNKADKTAESILETENDSKDKAVELKEKKKERKSKEKKNVQEHDVAGDDDCIGKVDQKQNVNSTVTDTSDSNKPEEKQTDPGQADAPQTATLGQWSTNMFQNSERQNKFLRLLGGFRKGGESSPDPLAAGKKKGLYGSLQQKQETNVSGQRALTHQAAQEMNRRLESDYERALSFSARGQRGIGLGFTPDPAEGKKFHIDTSKVVSKKFVD